MERFKLKFDNTPLYSRRYYIIDTKTGEEYWFSNKMGHRDVVTLIKLLNSIVKEE